MGLTCGLGTQITAVIFRIEPEESENKVAREGSRENVEC
jgi:hypothetical protein